MRDNVSPFRMVSEPHGKAFLMPLSPGALEQRIVDVDKDAKAAHGRNHERFEELQAKVDIIEATLSEHGARILDQDRRITEQSERLSGQDRRRAEDRRAPVEAGQLRLTPGMVVGIVAMVVTLGSGFWTLSAKMDAQAAINASSAKLQEERMAAMRQAIDNVDKRQQLQQLKLESLTETVLKLKR